MEDKTSSASPAPIEWARRWEPIARPTLQIDPDTSLEAQELEADIRAMRVPPSIRNDPIAQALWAEQKKLKGGLPAAPKSGYIRRDGGTNAHPVLTQETEMSSTDTSTETTERKTRKAPAKKTGKGKAPAKKVAAKKVVAKKTAKGNGAKREMAPRMVFEDGQKIVIKSEPNVREGSKPGRFFEIIRKGKKVGTVREMAAKAKFLPNETQALLREAIKAGFITIG